MKKMTTPVYTGLFLIVLFGFMLYRSLAYPYTIGGGRPGAGFFPIWLSILILVFSSLYIYQSIKGKEEDVDVLPKDKTLRSILYVFGCMVLFVLIAPYVGFVSASTLFLFMLFYYEKYIWYKALSMSLVTSIILFLLFNTVLGVALPVNDFAGKGGGI